MASVLLIEDDELVRRSLEIQLESAGHDVEVAAHGGLGLRMLARRAFDVVITDILMPEVEGLETIMAIRKRHPGVRIIAISGGGRVRKFDFLEIAKSLGATHVLRKPFSPGALIALVERSIKGAGDSQA